MSSTVAFLAKIIEIFKAAASPSKLPTLLKIADDYEKELAGTRFVYSLNEKGRKPVKVKLEFDETNFCHLFSISSIVKNVTPDTEQFAGINGWNNIKNGRITFGSLRKMDPKEFSYYQPEYSMYKEMIETIKNPEIVAYDPDKVPGSKLKSDFLLYKVFGAKVVHIGISKGEDGMYFPRSFFIRDVNKDKAYPTKYIAPMKHYRVKTETEKRKNRSANNR